MELFNQVPGTLSGTLYKLISNNWNWPWKGQSKDCSSFSCPASAALFQLAPCTPLRWSEKWQPTPVFLPGKSHGQRSLAGFSPWGHKESDMNEQLNSGSSTSPGGRACHCGHGQRSVYYAVEPRGLTFPIPLLCWCSPSDTQCQDFEVWAGDAETCIHLEHLEHCVRLTWLPRGPCSVGPAAWPLEVPRLLPAFLDCSYAFHFLSSQPPQWFNACHLLFNIESVSAACNQKHGLITRDFGPQCTDQEVLFWVVTLKQKAPLLEHTHIKKYPVEAMPGWI